MDNKTTAAVPDSIVEQRSELNGAPAMPDELRKLALFNYGHFTSMQVEGGGVRGLELHLQRLADATRELFGAPLDVDAVRVLMRHVLVSERDNSSLRVNVFSRALQRERMSEPAVPDVLMTCSLSRAPAQTPLRLKTFRHQRTLPHIKHVGTFELFHHRRLAQQAGCDDALFVDATGAISEGSIWNIGFFDGDGIVWPDAPQLRGVSKQLLQIGLGRRGVSSMSRRIELGEVGAFRSAFFTNSACAVRPIASIDGTEFKIDPELFAMLTSCYASNAPQPI